MYESFKEYKNTPGKCPFCDKPTISNTEQREGNVLEESVSCSGCKTTWRNRYFLTLVDRLKLSPAAKKILADRKKEEEDRARNVDEDTPTGRQQAGI